MGQESVVEGLTIQKSVKYINLSMHVSQIVTNNLFYFNKFLPISSVWVIYLIFYNGISRNNWASNMCQNCLGLSGNEMYFLKSYFLCCRERQKTHIIHNWLPRKSNSSFSFMYVHIEFQNRKHHLERHTYICTRTIILVYTEKKQFTNA